MNLKWISLVGGMVCAMAAGLVAEDECCRAKAATDYGRLKELVGNWEAVQEKDGKKEALAVNYKLTAGGTALMETLFPGTPKEMVSIYHDNDGKLMLTHYCMLGNQPRMQLKEKSDKVFKFDFVDGTGIASPKAMHMHALTVTFLDKDHFRQEWALYADGKQKEVERLEFSRKK